MKIPKQAKPVLRIPAPVKGEKGLGDVIKNITSAIGIDPCRGCRQRAATLNRWVGFTPIGRQGQRR